MITKKKVEKALQMMLNYAQEGCYQASERQFFCIIEEFVNDFAKLKNPSPEKLLEFHEIAKLIAYK